MPQEQIGRYEAWATLNGLDLTGCINGYHLRVTLTPQEALGLLQLLSARRSMFFQALYPNVPGVWRPAYPCPACGAFAILEATWYGYEGSCRECAHQFHLDMVGRVFEPRSWR